MRSKRQEVEAAFQENPTANDGLIAIAAGVSRKTVLRHLKGIVRPSERLCKDGRKVAVARKKLPNPVRRQKIKEHADELDALLRHWEDSSRTSQRFMRNIFGRLERAFAKHLGTD